MYARRTSADFVQLIPHTPHTRTSVLCEQAHRVREYLWMSDKRLWRIMRREDRTNGGQGQDGSRGALIARARAYPTWVNPEYPSPLLAPFLAALPNLPAVGTLHVPAPSGSLSSFKEEGQSACPNRHTSTSLHLLINIDKSHGKRR